MSGSSKLVAIGITYPYQVIRSRIQVSSRFSISPMRIACAAIGDRTILADNFHSVHSPVPTSFSCHRSLHVDSILHRTDVPLGRTAGILQGSRNERDSYSTGNLRHLRHLRAAESGVRTLGYVGDLCGALSQSRGSKLVAGILPMHFSTFDQDTVLRTRFSAQGETTRIRETSEIAFSELPTRNSNLPSPLPLHRINRNGTPSPTRKRGAGLTGFDCRLPSRNKLSSTRH